MREEPHDDEPDFRDEAEAASEPLLSGARRPGSAPPPAGGPLAEHASYCVRAPGGGRAALRRFRRTFVLALVIGFVGFGASGLIIWLQDRGTIGPAKAPGEPRPAMTPASEVPLIVASVACLATGMAALFLGATVQRRRTLALVGNRAWGARLPAADGVFFVSVENQATMHTMKLVADDLAMLLAEPEHRRVRIEGVSHRYLIRAEDLVELEREASTHYERVLVTYRIGDARLALAVVPEGHWAALWRQALGRPSRLLRQMSECLE